jgi:LuxR family transcriptional regulator, maltose regulon positive regulatory protein
VASLPDGSPSIEPWLATLLALLCRDGVEQIRADAELAASAMAAGSFWRNTATVCLAMAHLMAGDPVRADVLFADTAAGGAGGETVGACVALADRSLLAIDAGAWEAGERRLSEAWSLARNANLEDYPPVRSHLALSDFAAAQILLREVAEVLARRPSLGVSAEQAKDLQVKLSRTRGSRAPGASALTAAELRLLPMLGTHLSFPEIAGQIFLSPNTVKSQAMSIYHKLSASSRNQAVTRSRELGLLEG